jgi:hypothetical protein
MSGGRGAWACHAYGEGPCALLCFFQESHRACRTEQECDVRMVVERERLYRVIQERAAADPDDQAAAYLAEQFTAPTQLLGGPDADPPARSG